jgi:tetratricopeptide (TPR) repeat protein
MAEHLITIEEARENLLACAAFLAEDIKSADGHAEAMKTIVPSYLAKDNVDLAAEFSNTVDDPFTRNKLLTIVAAKCAAIDDDEYAMQLVGAIDDHGLQAQALEKIILQKSAKGDYDKALLIAEDLEHPEYALADIAIHLTEKGDETKAIQLLGEIKFPSAKVSALLAMASANTTKEANERAAELLEKALETTSEIEHSEEKIRALNDVGNLFIEVKRPARAIETFDKAKQFAEKLDNTHRDLLLGTTALGFFRAGSIDLADRALDLVNDKTQLASVLVGYSREYWEKDEKQDAIETLEEAHQVLKSQHERETRDSRAKFNLFTMIAVQFALFEKPERAIEIAQANPDESEQISGLSQIAQVFTTQEKDALARQSLNAITEDSQRLFAIIGVSDAKEKSEKREDAINLLNEAAQLAETIPQLSARSQAFNELAQRFNNYGETKRAREVSHENLEIIAEIRDESIRAVALANLAEVYEDAKFELTDTEKEILYTMIRRAEW